MTQRPDDRHDDRPIGVVFDPPLPLHGTDELGATLITEETHGPFRFSSIGVAFQAGGRTCFAPWSRVGGVLGWEPGAGSKDEKKKGG